MVKQTTITSLRQHSLLPPLLLMGIFALFVQLPGATSTKNSTQASQQATGAANVGDHHRHSSPAAAHTHGTNGRHQTQSTPTTKVGVYLEITSFSGDNPRWVEVPEGKNPIEAIAEHLKVDVNQVQPLEKEAKEFLLELRTITDDVNYVVVPLF